MSTIATTRNKVVVFGTLTPLSFVRRYLKLGDVDLLREEYHLIDLLFSIEEFHAQGPTLLYLIERGRVESKRGIGRRYLEFNFGGSRSYEFGPVEFALMTGLSFGEYPRDDKMISKLPALLHKKKKSKGTAITLNDVEVLMETMSKGGDYSTLRKVVALYLLHTIVFSKDKKGIVGMTHVNLVDMPDEFNTYPWGRLIYDDFVRDIHGLLENFVREDIFEEDSVNKKVKKEKNKKKIKRKHLKMTIFPYALQGWLFDCLPKNYADSLAHRKSRVDLPRLKRWKTVTEDYKIARQIIFDVAEVKLTKMTAELSEVNQQYFKYALAWIDDVVAPVDRRGSSSSGSSSSDEDSVPKPRLTTPEFMEQVSSIEKSKEERLKSVKSSFEDVNEQEGLGTLRSHLENFIREEIGRQLANIVFDLKNVDTKILESKMVDRLKKLVANTIKLTRHSICKEVREEMGLPLPVVEKDTVITIRENESQHYVEEVDIDESTSLKDNDIIVDSTQVGGDEGHDPANIIGARSKDVDQIAASKSKDFVKLPGKRNRKPSHKITSPYIPLVTNKAKKPKKDVSKPEVQLPFIPSRLRATDLIKFVPRPHQKPSLDISMDPMKAGLYEMWKLENQKNKDAKLKLVTNVPAYLSFASLKELRDARGWLTNEG